MVRHDDWIIPCIHDCVVCFILHAFFVILSKMIPDNRMKIEINYNIQFFPFLFFSLSLCSWQIGTLLLLTICANARALSPSAKIKRQYAASTGPYYIRNNNDANAQTLRQVDQKDSNGNYNYEYGPEMDSFLFQPTQNSNSINLISHLL